MATRTTPPNILVICSDHHRADTLGCAGHPVCRTPNLDALAAAGVQFNRCFSQNPVCSPARASMWTGTNNHRNGVLRNGIPLRRDVPTLADAFKPHGYQTAAVGKTHVRPQNEGVHEAPFYGFDRLDSVEDNSVGPYLDWALREFPEHEGYLIGNLFNIPTDDAYWAGKRDLRKEYLQARKQHVEPLEISEACNWGFGHYSTLPEAAHKTRWITDRALDAIHTRDPNKPLLMWVGYVDPHNPFDPPGRFGNMYAPDDMPPPVRNEAEQALWPPHTRALHQYFKAFSDRDWRTLRALFYGSVTFMDEQIGRLLATVDAELDAENTIVVYTADHGDMLGDHGICGKSAYHYDGGIRVPLIWRWPRQWRAGQRTDDIVEQTDLLPTLLDAVGLPAASVMDGRSYAPLLTGQPLPNPRGHAFSESYNGGPEDPTPAPATWARTIRTDHWRATFYPGVEYGELYDVSSDPGELVNRWTDPACRPVIEEHRRILMDRLILQDFPIAPLDYSV